MVNLRKIALDMLLVLKAAGADEAECTVNFTSTDETNSLGKEIYLIREFDSTDIEFNVTKDGRSAQMRINQTDKESMERAARECMNMVSSKNSSMDFSLGYKGEVQPDKLLKMKRDPEKLYMRFEELMNTLKNDYPTIYSDAMASYIDSKTLYLNTLGQEVTSHNQRCSCGWQGGASDGITTTDCEFFYVECKDLETPFIEQGMVKAKLENVQKMLNPKKIEGGKFEGTIVLSPEALCSYTNQILSRLNSMKDGDGLPVPTCSPCISLFEADSDTPYTSESPANNSPSAQVKYFIKNGEIVPDPVKALSKEEKVSYDMERKKVCERLENHVLGIQAGNIPYNELIRNVKKGLLIGFISGTMPNKNGDFSGAAKNSFYIEDGEIKFPVIETMVYGNVFEMFKHVEGISKETVNHFNNLLPWIAVNGITIM